MSRDASKADRPRVFLIDSYGFIFRAFHARARMQAPPMRTTTGIPTEAILIFHNMLRKLSKTFAPRYMAAVFEGLGKTHREEEFAEYKANRSETPPDLIVQIPYIERILNALRVPIMQYAGFEADDVIGTLSRKAAEAGFDVVIVSSDKDMLQLVTEHVSMLNPAKDDTWYDPAKVKEFMGVEPAQVAHLLRSERRRDRQHSGRARHRGKRRAGASRAVRVGPGIARPGGGSHEAHGA